MARFPVPMATLPPPIASNPAVLRTRRLQNRLLHYRRGRLAYRNVSPNGDDGSRLAHVNGVLVRNVNTQAAGHHRNRAPSDQKICFTLG
jgi:hypothetical protein